MHFFQLTLEKHENGAVEENRQLMKLLNLLFKDLVHTLIQSISRKHGVENIFL